MADGTRISCQEVFEVVTDYLEDALPERDRLRFEAHLAECDACRDYGAQFEQTIALSGRIDPDQLPPALQDELLSAFRAWRDER